MIICEKYQYAKEKGVEKICWWRVEKEEEDDCDVLLQWKSNILKA